MQLITAPEKLDIQYYSVFLAGSIEQDKAIDWQNYIIQNLLSRDITILNPRRKEWDASWKQSIENIEFRGQVEWELEALERADKILMYFDPLTKAPISLLELGLFARTTKLLVCCPEGYWRKGNVDIVCQKYDIPQVNSLKELTDF